jgi:hypothetical protein
VLGWLGDGDVRVEPDVLHEHDVKDGSSQELLMPWFLLRMGGGASYLDRAFIIVLSLLDLSIPHALRLQIPSQRIFSSKRVTTGFSGLSEAP